MEGYLKEIGVEDLESHRSQNGFQHLAQNQHGTQSTTIYHIPLILFLQRTQQLPDFGQ